MIQPYLMDEIVCELMEIKISMMRDPGEMFDDSWARSQFS